MIKSETMHSADESDVDVSSFEENTNPKEPTLAKSLKRVSIFYFI